MKIILASKSPRRKELLEQIGMQFEIIPSVGEEVITQTNPVEVVKELASQKAAEIETKTEGDRLIIGADTIVVYENQILGKPKDKEDAIRMLSMLQNHTHSVYTGVSLIRNQGKDRQVVTFAEETKVVFCPMTKEEIEGYVSTLDPMDKAGSYGIQGMAAAYIERINGDYNNVVGLPVGRIYQEMKKRGWDVR